MNPYFAKDIADHRHLELMAQAEQSRRYHAALATARPAARPKRRRLPVVGRPLAAVHSWLVAGVL